MSSDSVPGSSWTISSPTGARRISTEESHTTRCSNPKPRTQNKAVSVDLSGLAMKLAWQIPVEYLEKCVGHETVNQLYKFGASNKAILQYYVSIFCPTLCSFNNCGLLCLQKVIHKRGESLSMVRCTNPRACD